MRTIWKFELAVTDQCLIMMPEGAQVLCVQEQNGAGCLWAIVNPEAEKKPRTFYVRGTGHKMNGEEKKYVGTFQMLGGQLVFHVFEGVGS